MIKALRIENVRCFKSPAVAPLAPLTLLVGENSTGKSTFLAAVRLACQLATGLEVPEFNEEPFLLGAYDQIAHRGSSTRKTDYFRIGAELRIPSRARREHSQQELVPGILGRDPDSAKVVATFANKSSQPALTEWRISSGAYELAVVRDASSARIEVATPSGAMKLDEIGPEGRPVPGIPIEALADPFFYDYYLRRHVQKQSDQSSPGREGEKPIAEADLRVLSGIFRRIREAVPRKVYASAPIRTEPRRTYEPLKDVPRPGGGHVPMVLAKRYGAADWLSLKNALEGFGTASGLFRSIEVKRLGKEESSPFQILIKIAGPAFNLVDVGYGVSQVLPIVVDLLQSKKGSMFLLQQPEVHLHPRAQAELGSLMCQLVRSEGKSFVVETHSDYLLDRVRMDVRDRKGIRSGDVVILYFERKGGQVEISDLRLDDAGNIVEPPAGYRRFFLEEQHRFLVG